MIPEVLAFLAASTHMAWNYYSYKPVYARFYRTLLLGGGTYLLSIGVKHAVDRKKLLHLQAIDHYKSQFPERVPEKSYPTFGEVLKPWRPLR
uniref:Uncharacterized protein n=1 Tax=Trichobilharzia regenti TaxID=157069 RepID=A0AA85JIX7_TRIRE|nr:unnamed protein product [Trichobilharzia regenti]